MKKGKHTPGRVLYITGLLVPLVFFTACKTPFGGYWEYEFSNETSYYITVSLNESYKTSTKESSERNTSLYLYYDSSETVYVKSGSLGFEWDSGANRNIYPEKNGSKVTFKERKK
jgi:hypothetical protein